MKSNGRIVLLVVVVLIVLGAVVLSGALSSDSSTTESATSPACLPSTLAHEATLAGTDVDVSPEPGTDTANPRTQISFLGVEPSQISEILVRGSRSGSHTGSLRAYSQGDGASFVPQVPFRVGERVSVTAKIATHEVSFSFGVDTPYSTAHTSEFPNPQAAPADYQSFYTMPGAQAPVLTVTMPDHDPAAGDILTTNGPGAGQYGPLIYSPQGQLVWFARLPDGETAEDLNEQNYEGQRDLTWWRGRVLSLGFGQGEDVVMNNHYQTVARVHGGNGLKADLHDFRIAPGDVAYVTAFNPIRCNLTSEHGSAHGTITDTAVQEIDMRTGLVRWEWHSLDHVGASESEVETPSGSEPWDWFHINSIDLQQNGNLFISARSTWAAYELQAGSGRILWRLGGLKSSFQMGPGTKTAWQHDGRVLANGDITLFDDGSNPPIHSQSRAITIHLDLKTHQARLVSSYTHSNPPLLAASQGNMQTLSGGDAVVGYGGVPAISEYAPGGTLLLDAHLPWDMAFYRAFRYPWRATPSRPPAVMASLNNTGEETIVHSSWNGATEVASWRILAGKSASSLKPLADIPAAGFETSTTLPNRYTYAAVQARNADGQVLGSSPTTKVLSYSRSLSGKTG